jgi:hypothetical protein
LGIDGKKSSLFRLFSHVLEAGQGLAKEACRSPAPELWAGRHWGRGGVLVAEVNSAFGQVVRGHFDCNPIARQNPDPVFFHFTGRVGKRLVPVVEPHLEARIRQQFHYGAFEFDQIFFRQWLLSDIVSRD